MQVKLEIDFEQLVEAVKSLPSNQLGQLMAEIERKNRNPKSIKELKNLLLKGPVATKKQLETIENNRKAINQWRTN
jgi:hypothetical protein